MKKSSMPALAGVLFGLLLLAIPAVAQDGLGGKERSRLGFFEAELHLDADGKSWMSWTRPADRGARLFLAPQGHHPERAPWQLNPTKLLEAGGTREFALGPGAAVATVWKYKNDRSSLRVEFPSDGNKGGTEVLFDAGAPGAALLWRGPRLHAAVLDGAEGEPAMVHVFRLGPRAKDRVESWLNLEGHHPVSVAPTLTGSARRGLELYWVAVDHAEELVVLFSRSNDGQIWSTPSRLFELPTTPNGPILVSDGKLLWGDGVDIYAWQDGGVGLGAIAKGQVARAVAGASGQFLVRDGESAMLINPQGRGPAITQELAGWCQHALVVDGQLLMIGDIEGELFLEAGEWP